MAQENILNLIGTDYEEDKVKFLYDKLGEKAFKGQPSNAGDMTVTGYLTYLVIKGGISTASTWQTLLKANIDEKNNKGQNILLQALLAFRNDKKIKVTDIIDKISGVDKLSVGVDDLLTQPDVNKTTAAHVICDTPAYAQDFDFKTYAKSFKDANFDDSVTKPITLLIKNELKDALSDIVDTITSKGKISDLLNPFPKKTGDMPNDSLIQSFFILNEDKLIDQITDSDKPIGYLLTSSVFKDSTFAWSDALGAITVDNITGIKPEETAFSFDTYSTNVSSKGGSSKECIHPYFYLINKLSNSITKDVITNIEKSFSCILAPIVSSKSEGFTPFMLLCNLLTINDSYDSWKSDDILTKVNSEISSAISAIPSTVKNDFKKFLALNAILGNVRQLSNFSSTNLFGPINIIFNKINTAHQNWCNKNKKSFDDYKDTFDDLISSVMGSSASFVSFDNAYKYWCDTYNKKF